MPLNLYSKESTDTLLAAKLDLAGGTMTGGLTLSASGIIFSDATYLTTAPAGSTLAADQLTAGVVAANPTSGPTTAGDVLQYNGTDLVWAAGGSSFNGGAIANPITIAGATIDSEMSSDFFGVELSADPTKGSVLYYTGLDTYDGSSHMLVGPTGLTFPDSTTQTTAGIGDAPSDGSQYARKDGAWEVVTGGGSVAWGGITGTVTDQTDLVTYVTGLGYQTASDVSTYAAANFYPLSSNPAGYLTSVPGKTVYEVTSNAYTLASTDANNIVYIPGSASGGFPPINITVPDDATYSFPIGTIITLSVDNVTGGSDISLVQGDPYSPAPILIGTTGISSSTSGNFLLTKVAANRWICS